MTLIHPGEDGNVKVMKHVSVGNGRQSGLKLQSEDFLVSGLFRKIAISEFGIQAAITDTDRENPFALFLTRVLSGVFNSIVKSPIDDISNVLVSNTASEVSTDIQGKIKGKTDEKITVVGVSPVAKFSVQDDGMLTLKMQA